MRYLLGCAIVLLLIGPGILPRVTGADSVEDLLNKARTALAGGQADEALSLAGKAIARDGKSAPAFFFRGTMQEALQHHKEAVADFDKAIALDPTHAEDYDHRGSEQFNLGHIATS